jgi:hypothetical protein
VVEPRCCGIPWYLEVVDCQYENESISKTLDMCNLKGENCNDATKHPLYQRNLQGVVLILAVENTPHHFFVSIHALSTPFVSTVSLNDGVNCHS